MSLPPLAALPAPLLPLAERAAALLPAAWPAERTEALRRSYALSDFVYEQAVRDSQLLAELGAQIGQGWLFAKPLDAQAFRMFVAQH